MAFDKTLMVPIYQAGAGAGNILKITSTGKTLESIVGEEVDSNSNQYGPLNPAFVWNGNVFLPIGRGGQNTLGFVGYLNHNDELGFLLGEDMRNKILPFGDKVLFLSYQYVESGSSPFNRDGNHFVKTYTSHLYDVCIRGEEVFWTQYQRAYKWNYPFTVAPSALTGMPNYGFCIVEFKGDVYIIASNGGNQYVQLFKWNGVTWAQVGSDFDTGGSGMQIINIQWVAFQYNEKLWLVVQQRIGFQRVRCWEIDVTTGNFTEHNSDVPANLKVNAAAQAATIVVPDDTGSSRQIFLLFTYVQSYVSNVWYLYEFADGSEWSLVNSGTERFSCPYGAAIWDKDAKGARIGESSQNIAGHVDFEVHVANLQSNGSVDIDPRYKKSPSATDFPPYSQCTEMTGVGSEGKTSLASIPTGITTLAHLSDDWADSILNANLWEIVNTCINGASLIRDYGIGYSYAAHDYSIVEDSGIIRFPDSTTGPPKTGIALKSKWWMTGAFQIDIELQNLTYLYSSASDFGALALFIKERTHKGYGILIFKRSAGVYKAKPFVFQQNTSPATKGSDSTHTLSDGEKIRIVRNASDVWKLTADPDTANETLTLGVNPNYDGPVQIFICGLSLEINFVASDPGPAFGPIVVSGAGALGKYDGALKHDFAWDVVTDLGGGYTGLTRLFADAIS